jgi:transcriptional regulator with GAF, ATPase, and Fis domain
MMKTGTWNAGDKYEFLLRITNAIVTQTNSEDFFSSLAKEMKEFIEYDRLSIYILDQNAKAISYFAKADGVVPEGMENLSGRPLDKASIAQLAITTGSPVIIEDLEGYARFSTVPDMRRAGLVSTMAFPLITRNRVLGTMHISFKRNPEDFAVLSVILNDLSKQVAIAVDNMLAHTQLRHFNESLEMQKRYLQAQARLEHTKDAFVFTSEKMRHIMEQASMVAESDVSVLITGETGTGKDLLAQHIHDLGQFRDNLFVKINCPALAAGLFESELFGHEKGSFTGAHACRIGRFEMAHGGSVFLDEIGELPLSLQAKLLQVLQDGTFERVGCSKSLKADFRVIAATNQDMQAAMNSGRFRKDLYYRLSSMTFHLPPLRERKEDIAFLVEKFNALEVARTSRPAPIFSPPAIEALCRHPWPGNVRELKSFIKKMFVLMPGKELTAPEVSRFMGESGSTGYGELAALRDHEKKLIEEALMDCKGVVGGPRGAAKRLGLPTSTLQYRLKKFKVDPVDFTQRNTSSFGSR